MLYGNLIFAISPTENTVNTLQRTMPSHELKGKHWMRRGVARIWRAANICARKAFNRSNIATGWNERNDFRAALLLLIDVSCRNYQTQRHWCRIRNSIHSTNIVIIILIAFLSTANGVGRRVRHRDREGEKASKILHNWFARGCANSLHCAMRVWRIFTKCFFFSPSAWCALFFVPCFIPLPLIIILKLSHVQRMYMSTAGVWIFGFCFISPAMLRDWHIVTSCYLNSCVGSGCFDTVFIFRRTERYMAHKSIQMRIIDFLFTDCCTCHNCQIDSFLNNGTHARRAHTHTHGTEQHSSTNDIKIMCKFAISVNNAQIHWLTLYFDETKIALCFTRKYFRLKKIYTLCQSIINDFTFVSNERFPPNGFEPNRSHGMRNMQISCVFQSAS